LKRRWHIRKYKKGEEQKISDAMKIVYGHGIDKEVWNWFYSKNPFKHLYAVADCENQIVGFMGLAGKPLEIERKQFRACIATGLGVHPDFRRQGIFTTLGRYIMNEVSKEGIQFCYGFPNDIARLGHLKYGWFDVCPHVPAYVKYLTAKGFLKSHKISTILDRLKVPNFLRWNPITSFSIYILLKMTSFYCTLKFSIRNHPKTILELVFINHFDEGFDDFWDKVWIPRKIAVKRDSKYLNWRYFRKPHGKYVVLVAKKDGEVVGFMCILMITRNERRTGCIADFLTLPDDVATANVLLQEGIKYCKKRKADVVGCWLLGNNEYLKVLKHNGFLSAAYGRRLIARINTDEMQKYRPILEKVSNWYITLGDADFDLSF
jgi:GNAT superfamily N-acetyltransferase